MNDYSGMKTGRGFTHCLCAAVALCAIARRVTGEAPLGDTTGTCDYDVAWTYSDVEKELVITGSGTMISCIFSQDVLQDATTVKINADVTSIDMDTFAGFSSLLSVSI